MFSSFSNLKAVFFLKYFSFKNKIFDAQLKKYSHCILHDLLLQQYNKFLSGSFG